MNSILIVEDDLQLLRNIQLILQMEDFEAMTAINGQSGISMIREKRPDLILCDIMMPEMDGHAFLATLKSEPTLADIPFIFITALDERSDIRRGMTAGADDYLTKPFSSEELVAAVKGRLERIAQFRCQKDDPETKKSYEWICSRITARELEILLMVGKGMTSKEIAEAAGIKLNTVEVHRANLMRKLDAANAAMLTRWALIAEKMSTPPKKNTGRMKTGRSK